jgi:3-hydroxypropanoate dehydrogenase
MSLLAEIYDLMRLGPTAMNSQPLRIVFIRTAAGKARLLPHLAEGNRPKSASAPVVAILAADADYHLHLDRFAPHQKGARERLAANPETRLKDATFNATLQAGYFILAARAVGLDAGPMGGFDRAGIDAEFFDGTAVHSILVVNTRPCRRGWPASSCSSPGAAGGASPSPETCSGAGVIKTGAVRVFATGSLLGGRGGTMCSVVVMVAGLVLVAVGIVWFFQGIGSLERSPMTGVSFWAYAGRGSGAFVLGLGLLALRFRCRPRTSSD